MRSLLRGVFAFALLCVLSVSAPAQEKKPVAKDDPKTDPLTQPLAYLKAIKFDKEQEEKLAAVKKEFGPKFLLVSERNDKIMTAERKKTAAEARKKATDDGKKGKEVQEAVDAALKLSADEQAEMTKIRAERTELTKALKAKIETFLTDEQKKALQPKPKTDK